MMGDLLNVQGGVYFHSGIASRSWLIFGGSDLVRRSAVGCWGLFGGNGNTG